MVLRGRRCVAGYLRDGVSGMHGSAFPLSLRFRGGHLRSLFLYLCHIHAAARCRAGAVTGMSVERRWINEWVGYVAAHFLGISFTAHRRSHLKHHRATNDPTEDPDIVLSASSAARAGCMVEGCA